MLTKNTSDGPPPSPRKEKVSPNARKKTDTVLVQCCYFLLHRHQRAARTNKQTSCVLYVGEMAQRDFAWIASRTLFSKIFTARAHNLLWLTLSLLFCSRIFARVLIRWTSVCVVFHLIYSAAVYLAADRGKYWFLLWRNSLVAHRLLSSSERVVYVPQAQPMYPAQGYYPYVTREPMARYWMNKWTPRTSRFYFFFVIKCFHTPELDPSQQLYTDIVASHW